MIKDSIVRAYKFAEDAHAGTERKFSGLPYFTHVKFVARTLEKLNCREAVIIAGFLHDTIEDTDKTYEDVEREFGKEVADIVQGVTSDGEVMKMLGGKRLYLAKKMSEMSDDQLVVKLADRFHNVLFLENDETPQEFVRKYYKETRYILITLRELERKYNDVHLALMHRIEAILEFLKIRYEF